MDWVLSEIEVQEHALAIWRQAASVVLTDDQPKIDEAGQSQQAFVRPVVCPARSGGDAAPQTIA